MTVLFRIKGVIEEKMKLPAHMRWLLIGRYKQMADIDPEQQD